MACERNPSLVTRAARRLGITAIASKSAFLSGFSPKALFSRLGKFRRNRRLSAKTATRNGSGASVNSKVQKEPVNPLPPLVSKNRNQGESKSKDTHRAREVAVSNAAVIGPGLVNGSGGEQVSLFIARSQPTHLVVLNQNGNNGRQVVTPRHISISGLFTEEELDTLTVELIFNQAATARQLREIASGTSRGVDFKDPRAVEHIRSDKKNYDFLIGAVRDAKYGRGLDRRGVGYIDTSSLADEALVDLHEFSRFETDRLARQIDHLAQSLSHIKGPTADYIIGKHRVEARFYNHLASQLEPLITTEMQDDYWGWDKE